MDFNARNLGQGKLAPEGHAGTTALRPPASAPVDREADADRRYAPRTRLAIWTAAATLPWVLLTGVVWGFF